MTRVAAGVAAAGPLAPGDALVIAARPLPLPVWTVNVNRVVAVAPSPLSPAAAEHAEGVALVWVTTPAHSLVGEELVTLSRATPPAPPPVQRGRRHPPPRAPLPGGEGGGEVVFELVSYSRGACVAAGVGGLWVRAMQRAFARGVGDRLAIAAAGGGGG